MLISRRRDPPELMLLVLCLLSGVSFLVGVAPPPRSVESVMPTWLVFGWYTLLVVAGAIGATGNLWPGRVTTALRLRLAGQMFAAGPAAAYAIAAFSFVGIHALASGGLIVVWACMCAWQALILYADVRRLESVP